MDVFLSHSNKDKKIATILRERLEKHEINLFLAHVDLDGGVDWSQELFNNIQNCDLFMVLLSKNYHQSNFTDQELGIAIHSGKQILPITIDGTEPYGFLKKYQCKKYNPKFIKADIDKIAQYCKKLTKQNTSTVHILIDRLRNAESYVQAHSLAIMIQKESKFSSKQLNLIARAYLSNKEIHQSYLAAPIILKILSNNKEKIDSKLYDGL